MPIFFKLLKLKISDFWMFHSQKISKKKYLRTRYFGGKLMAIFSISITTACVICKYHIHIKHVLPEFSDSHDLSNYVLEIIHRKKQGFNFYPKKNTSYCVNHVLCFDFFSFGPNSSKNDQQHWQLNGHNFKFAIFFQITIRWSDV